MKMLSGQLLRQMPDHRVDVLEPGGKAAKGWITCEIGTNLRFDAEGLHSYCSASLKDEDFQRVYDAFLLGAAVQFCDHTKARPATAWGRNMVLRLPVHDREHWNSPAVSDSLRDALSFLTGDRWHFEFIDRKSAEQAPRQGSLLMPDASSIVLPYSDGLDSRAVAGLAELDRTRQVTRVRLGLSDLPRRRRRSDEKPFTQVPYSVRFSPKKAVETSGRSRGFRFTLLSGIAAYLSNAHDVFMTESGQGALGPTLVPVGQAYEDYRNHPLFTKKMSVFLDALFGHEVRYSFPRLWYTKGETVAAYVAAYGSDAELLETHSCWQDSRRVSVSGRKRQCGVCAACMLRRLSLYAAGSQEAPENYVWERLGASRLEDGMASDFPLSKVTKAMREYAIAGTLHMDHLAALRSSPLATGVLDRQASRLAECLSIPKEQAVEKLGRLIDTHNSEWHRFLASLGRQSFVHQWTAGVTR
ncbi:MAG: 7-cyano-7-deazaguanine synthase [Alphaproteobacteria bacterium]|nr:7-cyano-7-deazaguanine synthase [Alphaproteobacteria bacterium]